jgi:hypothetical protein
MSKQGIYSVVMVRIGVDVDSGSGGPSTRSVNE